ncbi:unnamed protein product [Lactuca saligna]|uniref:Uncharacterized protein n=1 Tax=Lactuca saligna TaxID=75948 RepID=A0AA35ZRL4_LACSI|nr:unnamed protein product [Lactuca saligna]
MNVAPCLGVCFFSGCLRKLDLSLCSLEDGDIICADIWDLPNLQVLDLEENNFSQLNFGLFRLPRLKLFTIELSCLENKFVVVHNSADVHDRFMSTHLSWNPIRYVETRI